MVAILNTSAGAAAPAQTHYFAGGSNAGYAWLTPNSRLYLERDYLRPGVSVEDRIDCICDTAELILNRKGFAAAFRKNFEKGWYSLSTPIWGNFGNNRGLPCSCYGASLSDSTESILRAQAEMEMMTKLGGGTSGYFGHLRSRGSAISTGGESNGSVSFMQLFDKAINVFSQGKLRRGSYAPYLPVDHGDIWEFLAIRYDGHPIQDLNPGLCVPDYWLEEMIAGDYEKRRVWAKVIEARAHTGHPYLFFTDTANRNAPDVYKKSGCRVVGSNLCCVTGDQRVVSGHGLLTAKELYERGGELLLFDGKRSVRASEMRLISPSEKVYRVTLENGLTHTVTACHKVQTDGGMVRADGLVVGTKVAIQTQAGLFGPRHMPDEAFLLGLWEGDGTSHEQSVMVDVWEDDFDLLPEIQEKFNRVFYKYGCDTYDTNHPDGARRTRHINPPAFLDCVVRQSTVKKKRLTSRCLRKALNFQKGVIPNWIWEADEETQWQYVRGLFYTDGTVNVTQSNGSPLHLSVSSVNKRFVNDLQILLLNLGVRTSLFVLRKAGENELPDGRGGTKLYATQTCYRLVCGNKPTALLFDRKTGFLTRKKQAVEDRPYRDNTKKFSKVKSVEFVGEEPVYCCEVFAANHAWVCNGVVTHNSEISLPATEDESFVCDLSSMNVLHFDQWRDTNAVELLVYFLDAVMEEFIRKAKQIPHMDRAARFAERHRALGVGWLGWHSYLQRKMVPFESMEAFHLNAIVARTIHDQAYAASAKMAQEYGEPPLLRGYGRRNATLLAIAPTKSSAFILGQVSEGIEAHLANYYIKDLQKGKFTVKNPHLEALLVKKGQNKDEVWEGILRRSGSVQHLDCLSAHEKDVFKTFPEISPTAVVNQAAQRQKWLDQSQSLNVWIHPMTPPRDVNALLLHAWRSGVKTMYYQHGQNAAQEYVRQLFTCKACES